MDLSAGKRSMEILAWYTYLVSLEKDPNRTCLFFPQMGLYDNLDWNGQAVHYLEIA